VFTHLLRSVDRKYKSSGASIQEITCFLPLLEDDMGFILLLGEAPPAPPLRRLIAVGGGGRRLTGAWSSSMGLIPRLAGGRGVMEEDREGSLCIRLVGGP
jgi:hypothetical protein